MLAQNFKTPADLEISDDEFDALAKVLGMLEREEIRRDDFDMDWPDGCGAPCCILGHARRLGAFRDEWLGGMPAAHCALFAPVTRVRYSTITPDQAAIALRNFLTHGEPRWQEALAS